jgi:hypothetical protein
MNRLLCALLTCAATAAASWATKVPFLSYSVDIDSVQSIDTTGIGGRDPYIRIQQTGGKLVEICVTRRTDTMMDPNCVRIAAPCKLDTPTVRFQACTGADDDVIAADVYTAGHRLSVVYFNYFADRRRDMDRVCRIARSLTGLHASSAKAQRR